MKSSHAKYSTKRMCTDVTYVVEDVIAQMSKSHDAANEEDTDLYFLFVDFEKAFDTVEHRAIFEALLAQGVDRRYVRTLSKLYSGQVGKAWP